MVRASDCQCTSSNGFNPSVRRHSGICGAADEAVLNTIRKRNLKKNSKNIKKNTSALKDAAKFDFPSPLRMGHVTHGLKNSHVGNKLMMGHARKGHVTK